jgi:hypothetical protein
MNVSLANGDLRDSYATSGLQSDQITQGLVRNVAAVPAVWSGSALDLGSVVSPGMAVFSNLDTANFVEIGMSVSGNFHAFLKLEAGQQAGPMFLSNMPLYARANTSPVNLFYILYEG